MIKYKMDKNNIVVFMKGGYLSDTQMDVWWTVFSHLQCIFIMPRLRAHNNYFVDVFFKLPTQRNSERHNINLKSGDWKNLSSTVKNTFLALEEKFFAVDIRTPNNLVYSELNIYPIMINSTVKFIQY